jgi:hypothetical protein
MERLEINILTRERKVIKLTPEEEAAALSQKAVWDAENTQDKRAMRAIDALDRLQFRRLFNHENRLRQLEGRPTVTAAAYRQDLIDEWKTLNP